MGLSKENITAVKAFARNVKDIPNSSRRVANKMAGEFEDVIRNRVSQGKFLGGDWALEGYSANSIKAYKLGRTNISGKGNNQTMTIDGIPIRDKDWYWGEDDMKKKGIRPQYPDARDDFGESWKGPPSPVFVPGYRGWRVHYKKRSAQVNLKMSGQMMNGFYVAVHKGRGTNQYGANWEFTFETDTPDFRGEYTDFYRNWKSITQDELRRAIRKSGADLTSLLIEER